MSMTTTANPHRDVPPPAGAVKVDDEWQQIGPDTYRYFEGLSWVVEADGEQAPVGVLIAGLQYGDGSVERQIALWRDFHVANAVTSRQARHLARALIAAADQLDELED